MPATKSDFDEAIRKIQSSVSQADLKRYQEWMDEFGKFSLLAFLIMPPSTLLNTSL